MTMQLRQLGNSELRLSRIGLGTWAIGGGGWAYGWGPQDDASSVRTIHRALDLGVNWIDTAAVYGLGHAEEVVARALQDRPGKVIVATKCGLRWRHNGKVYTCLGVNSVRQEAEQSLRRLKVDTIDLYQIHWPNPPGSIEEGWSAVADLVKEGKVRYAGVSNFDVDQLDRARKIHPVTSLQPPYSMIKPEIEHDLLGYCAAHDIGVIAYGPMYYGLLTGSFDERRLAALDPDDWRRKDNAFQEPFFSKALELVDRLRPLAQHAGRPLAQLAIAWVLRRSEVTAAIVGGRRPEQVEETIPAGDWCLDASELHQIDEIVQQVALPPLKGLR